MIVYQNFEAKQNEKYVLLFWLKGCNSRILLSMDWKKVRMASFAYPNVPGINFPNFSRYHVWWSINQSINQSVNQSINQAVSQSINQSINQAINQSVDQSIGHFTVLDKNKAGVDLVSIQPLLLCYKKSCCSYAY